MLPRFGLLLIFFRAIRRLAGLFLNSLLICVEECLDRVVMLLLNEDRWDGTDKSWIVVVLVATEETVRRMDG